jgi:hypothetical protein
LGGEIGAAAAVAIHVRVQAGRPPAMMMTMVSFSADLMVTLISLIPRLMTLMPLSSVEMCCRKRVVRIREMMTSCVVVADWGREHSFIK